MASSICLTQTFLGDGFLPFTADGEPVIGAALPDLDGNGLADVLEPPVPAAALPEGLIRTGLAGRGGCVVGGAGAPVDPLLPLLGVMAAAGMMYRRRRAR